MKTALAKIDRALGQRQSPYAERAAKQAAHAATAQVPHHHHRLLPADGARSARRASQFKAGEIDEAGYTPDHARPKSRAACASRRRWGWMCFVHGEAERNDMVEYFGEQLDGYAFSQFGWVQSYGSRCVKPPILFGDISRPKAMTVDWITYAQSLTDKPMKGMLTGPVTILNWSFVRDDQPRSVSCRQLALAIREEVLDLERAGVRVIQIDEAALREGLPLRQSQWKEYLGLGGRVLPHHRQRRGGRDPDPHPHVLLGVQRHHRRRLPTWTPMSSPSRPRAPTWRLLDAFDDFSYPNEIGPGVYDIHSPNIPSEEHMVELMRKAAERIPAERLWVNPDCGLKTRQWSEVIPALTNMVAAAKTLRAQAGG